MLRNIVTLFLFTSIVVTCNSKDYIIKGEIKGIEKSHVFLAQVYGEELTIIDSLKVNHDKINFSYDSLPTGLYKIVLKKKPPYHFSFALIINQEDIRFSTSIQSAEEDMNIKKSDENKIYYEFLRKDQSFHQKLQLLIPVIDNYPDKEDYYDQTVEEYTNIQKKRQNYINNIIEKYPNAFVSRILKIEQTPFVPADMTGEKRIDFLKKHFFEPFTLADTLLLRSNVYNRLVIDYLSLYRQRGNSPREQEEAFKEAVDKILLHAYINQDVYEFILNYLIEGFERFKMENVLGYIAEEHINKLQCESDEKKTLERRLEGYKKMAVGKTAPDFEITGFRGKHIKLSDVSDKYILVVFFSSDCKHCRKLLPKLNDLYEEKYKDKLKVVAISLDKNRENYVEFLSGKEYDWVNYCDFKGWNGAIPIQYNIYATPSIFLLNTQREILAKPITFNEIKKDLSRLDE